MPGNDYAACTGNESATFPGSPSLGHNAHNESWMPEESISIKSNF